jgi:hypothetical protein
VRRSPANPARPGREQRYRDHFVRRGVPEVPLICSARVFCDVTLWNCTRLHHDFVARLFRGGDFVADLRKSLASKEVSYNETQAFSVLLCESLLTLC